MDSQRQKGRDDVRPKLAISICLCWLLLPPICYSQQVEQPDSEALKTTARRLSNKPAPDLSGSQTDRCEDECLPTGGNRPSVAVNSKLTETAEYFAKYMAQTNKYGHNADGNQPADRVKKSATNTALWLKTSL